MHLNKLISLFIKATLVVTFLAATFQVSGQSISDGVNTSDYNSVPHIGETAPSQERIVSLEISVALGNKNQLDPIHLKVGQELIVHVSTPHEQYHVIDPLLGLWGQQKNTLRICVNSSFDDFLYGNNPLEHFNRLDIEEQNGIVTFRFKALEKSDGSARIRFDRLRKDRVWVWEEPSLYVNID